MRSILKNMKPQWKAVVLILLCLLVQAVCDLSLPAYTSSLIDVGIQSSGVEYAVPLAIRSSSYDAGLEQMTAEEAALWRESYVQNGDVYTRVGDVDEKALDEVFAAPIAQAALAARGAAVTRDGLALTGGQAVRSTAVAFVSAEYQALGIDLSAIQTGYLWRTGGKMLAMSLLMALAAVLSSLLAARVGASVGRDLRAKVFDKVVHFSGAEFSRFSTASLITRSTGDIQQIQLVTIMLLRMVAYAPLLAAGGILMVIRTGADMEWIILLAVALLLALVGTLMKLAMPRFKRMQSLVDQVNRIAREILTGLRGKGGGYRMNKPAEQCTVGSILRLTEGSLAPVACLDKKPVQCARAGECRTLPMWQKLDTLINEFFDGVTIADLAHPIEPGNDFVI